MCHNENIVLSLLQAKSLAGLCLCEFSLLEPEVVKWVPSVKAKKTKLRGERRKRNRILVSMNYSVVTGLGLRGLSQEIAIRSAAMDDSFATASIFE